MKNNSLTTKQKEVLDYIKKFQAANKYPPSVRQIGKDMGLKSPATIHVHINNLIDKGYLRRSEYGNRLIELLVPNEFEHDSKVTNVPFVGRDSKSNIAAELKTPNEYFALPSSMVPEEKDVFVLEVTNNNTNNTGIFGNDIVIMEKSKNVQDGDIIAIDVDNEISLKTFYENEDIKNTAILGRVIGLYRQF